MRYSKLVAGLTLATCSGLASAGLVIDSINVQMAYTPFSVNAGTSLSDAQSAFNAGTEYCDKDLEAFTGINSQGTCGGSNGGYGALYTITGTNHGVTEFQFGLDWGHGGFVTFESGDALITQKFTAKDNLWWSRNWNHAHVLGNEPFYTLDTKGAFSLTLLGFEGCCDGINSARYRTFEQSPIQRVSETQNTPIPSIPGEWRAVEVNAVPVPGSLPLMAIGALLLWRRRQS